MLSENNPRVDPRTRTRSQILKAAQELIAERGNAHFSADELSARAGVSRRSVFNHYISLDDVVMQVCAQVLARSIENFQTAVSAEPDDSARSVTALMSKALLEIDLLTPTSYLWKILGEDNPNDRSSHLLRNVFARVTDLLTEEVIARNNNVDPLEIELRVNALVGGLSVIAARWARETHGVITPDTRDTWDAYVRKVLSILAPETL